MKDSEGAISTTQDPIQFAFVGALIPSTAVDSYPGFSAAGNLWQSRLLSALQRQGFQCTKILSLRPVMSFPRCRRLIFAPGSAKGPDDLVITYLPFVNFGPIKTFTVGIANFIELVKWGWRHRHSTRRVIITYNVSAPHGLTTALAARASRTKAFAVIADLPVPGHGILPRTPLRRLDFALQVSSMRSLDGLVVLTRNMAQDFAPQVPFISVEGAIDGPLTRSIVAESPSEQNGQFVLMYAGLLSEFDGVHWLLEAFSLLSEERFRLVIVGRGPEQERVLEAAKNDSRISYMGYLTHEEVLKKYQRAHVLINPRPSAPLSTRYVFPSKLIEYLASGTPTITTATAGVLENYGEYAFILREETPTGLANLIRYVASISKTERCRMGSAARHYMLERKTWDIQGKRIAAFLRERFVTE